MGRATKILLLVAFVAYPILLHTFILKDQVQMWQLVFVFAPLLAVVMWVLFRIVGRVWWPLLTAAIVALFYFILSLHDEIAQCGESHNQQRPPRSAHDPEQNPHHHH